MTDLLLERDDRRKLAAVADDHQAEFVLVYLNTPLAVINQRRMENPRPGTQADIAEAKAQLDASLLERPDRNERAIYVSPADAVADVASKIRARLTARQALSAVAVSGEGRRNSAGK
jgi:predicted kinase